MIKQESKGSQVPQIKKTKFYSLLLIQVIIILSSTFYINYQWYYSKFFENTSSFYSVLESFCSIEMYFKLSNDVYDQQQYYRFIGEVSTITTICNFTEFLFQAYTCYPLIMITQIVLKSFNLPVNYLIFKSIIQGIIYVIQIPSMIFFTQALILHENLHSNGKFFIIQKENNITKFAQMNLVFLIFSLIFLILNERTFNLYINYKKFKPYIIIFTQSNAYFLELGINQTCGDQILLFNLYSLCIYTYTYQKQIIICLMYYVNYFFQGKQQIFQTKQAFVVNHFHQINQNSQGNILFKKYKKSYYLFYLCCHLYNYYNIKFEHFLIHPYNNVHNHTFITGCVALVIINQNM